jgi:cytoskeletal protein CcmA (bactofilin family)
MFPISHTSVAGRAADTRRVARLFFIVLFVGLSLLSTGSPASAQDGANEEKDLVVLTGRAEVSEDHTVGDLVIFNGPAIVAGTVDGDLVAFNGGVSVDGTIQGDVVAFNGTVRIQDGAVVEGDVRSRSSAQISEGAEIRGDVRGLEFTTVRDVADVVRFGFWVAVSISALLLTLGMVWLFPRAADAIAGAGTRVGASIGWGALLFFGVPILAVLLLVTIVAIPLGIGVLLALVPLYAFGYAATAYWLGRVIVGPPRSRALAALAGVVVLRLVALVPVLGGLTWFFATLFGLGLLALAARGRGRSEAAVGSAVATAQ